MHKNQIAGANAQSWVVAQAAEQLHAEAQPNSITDNQQLASTPPAGPAGEEASSNRRTVIERGETVPPTSGKGNQFKYKRGSKTTQPKK